MMEKEEFETQHQTFCGNHQTFGKLMCRHNFMKAVTPRGHRVKLYKSALPTWLHHLARRSSYTSYWTLQSWSDTTRPWGHTTSCSTTHAWSYTGAGHRNTGNALLKHDTWRYECSHISIYQNFTNDMNNRQNSAMECFFLVTRTKTI